MSHSEREALRATIAEVMSRLLKRPIAPGEHVTRADEPKWDSLLQVEMTFTIEDACDVTFRPELLPTLNSLDAFVDAVLAYRAEAA